MKSCTRCMIYWLWEVLSVDTPPHPHPASSTSNHLKWIMVHGQLHASLHTCLLPGSHARLLAPSRVPAQPLVERWRVANHVSIDHVSAPALTCLCCICLQLKVRDAVASAKAYLLKRSYPHKAQLCQGTKEELTCA